MNSGSSVGGRTALGKMCVLRETCFGKTCLDTLMNPFSVYFKTYSTAFDYRFQETEDSVLGQ